MHHKNEQQKYQFYDQMTYEWNLQRSGEMVLGSGDLNEHVGKYIDGFESVHGGRGRGIRNMEGRMLLEFCAEKNCLENI